MSFGMVFIVNYIKYFNDGQYFSDVRVDLGFSGMRDMLNFN